MKKRIVAFFMAALMAVGVIVTGNVQPVKVEAKNSEQTVTETPKYIFLFIGDGMSTPQIELTNYYLSANANLQQSAKVSVDGKEKEILASKNNLTMMNLPVTGIAQTYDSTSFAPDSASTATSIATGYKTWSGSINVSEDFTQKYETIAEKLKKQKGYKIGIISSVNLNHATPAAFYAHQKSRNNYYEIGLEMIASNFDYFAGGGLKKTKGSDGNQKDLYELAEENGYTVVKTQAAAEALTTKDGKAIVIDEHLADSDAMKYELDRKAGEWGLSDYVSKGISLLSDGNDNGFFMMVEGGKIDWACHANDAASTITDTIAMDQALTEAYKFYEKHPSETLIIVTGDHETGGLTIGYAGTDYDTFLTNINNQKISFQEFNDEYVANYKKNQTSFRDVMKDVTALFGLEAPEGANLSVNVKDNADSHPVSDKSGSLVLTDYELSKLKAAYQETMTRTGNEKDYSQEEYVLYGSYDPLTVTITHILNNKSGINFSSYAHTGLPVEVLAQGAGANLFEGYYDNTVIYDNLAKLTGVN